MITIVLPLYNIEKHKSSFRACLRSIKEQSYTNWELLLVNDGSTDTTNLIIETAAKRDNRIKALHKEHAGVEAARSYGISHASGQFITFIDQDDAFAPNALLHMRQVLIEDKSDVVLVNKKRFIFNTHILIPDAIRCSMSTRQVIKHEDYMKKHYKMFFGISDLPVTVWGKLYRTSLLQSICPLPPSVYGIEDLYFNMCVLPHASKISILPERLYLYRWGGWTAKSTDQLLTVGTTGYQLKKRQIAEMALPSSYLYFIAVELLNYSISHLESIGVYHHLDEQGLAAEVIHVLNHPDVQEAIDIVKKEGRYHKPQTDFLLASNADALAKELFQKNKKNRIKRMIKRSILFLSNLTS